MMKKFISFAAVAMVAAAASFTVPAVAGEVVAGTFCTKPMNGTEVPQGKCKYYTSKSDTARSVNAGLTARNERDKAAAAARASQFGKSVK